MRRRRSCAAPPLWLALRRPRRGGQVIVEAVLGLALMCLSLAMIAIIAYMMVNRTRTVMAARHAAWIGAHASSAYASSGTVSVIEDTIKRRFFVETNLVRVIALEYSSDGTDFSTGDDGLDSLTESKSTEGAFYRVEYGFDAANPTEYLDSEDDVPFPLSLFYVTFPVTGDQEIWEGTPSRSYLGGTNAFGLVYSQCKWDNVDETWKCFGNMLDYLWDMISDAISFW